MIDPLQLVVSLLTTLFLVSYVATLPFWMIFKKSGLSCWWSLLNLIPFFGWIIVLHVLAFRQWPSNELEKSL